MYSARVRKALRPPEHIVNRYIRENPDMPEHVKRLLRGDPDTSDIPEADEKWFNKAKPQ